MGKKLYEAVPILNDEKSKNDYGSTSAANSYLPKNQIKSNQLSYPRAVIFVLLSKFFEAFAANGVRTVLALYLRDSLDFSVESSMTFYHIFNFFSQFCPVFGAILADSYLGNVKTIFYIFFLYAIGWIGMVILTLPLQIGSISALIITSLILIAIGNGGIRACVTSLGGSQFELPSQSKQLDQYFSNYYFIYTLGILVAKIIPPEIRAQTTCFGQNECYTAVFGALGAMFLVAWIIFMFGMFLYKDEKIGESKSNILFQVIGCFYYGVKHKFRKRHDIRSMHSSWTDGAMDKYPEHFVLDLCAALKVLKLFLPLPMYFALFGQIDSSWTFQSSQLNTTVFGYRIEADQAKAAGALLGLILIPFWQHIVIPALLMYNIKISPLQSIAMGGFAAFTSFFCAAILQINIEDRIATHSAELSVLWQFPQFLLMMLAVVWLEIPGLAFSFTQSPSSMRSLMMAAWFCNSAFGNVIVIAITELRPFNLASSGYFLYAFLMLVAILVFSWLANAYQYTDYESCIDNNDNLIRRRSSNNVPYSAISSQDGLDLIF
ncbi:peptide transporter family 1-like [Contarinia nasturtii]|uniref:peptide transporter family 1-like n=1 Tax=Contarinia nasturtii TaxID=265458 RepID=UPI0012D477B7|nr:peptide transporter family 1-like [Contarinia nasturtii]